MALVNPFKQQKLINPLRAQESVVSDNPPGEEQQPQQEAETPDELQARTEMRGDRVAKDVLAGLAQMGHGIINTPYHLAQTSESLGMIPQGQAKDFPHQQDYDYGQLLGIKNPGLVDKGIQGASEYAPAALAGGFRYVPQILAAAAHGFTHSDNPLLGAAGGAATAATIGGAFNIGGKTASALFGAGRPAKIAERILGGLGEGKNLEETGKNIASSIVNSGKYSKQINRTMYAPVNKIMGGKEILPENYYNKISQKVVDDYLPDVRDMHNAFIENPTYENAHALQSELGTAQRSFDMPIQSAADKYAYQTYRNMRAAILKDMKQTMDSTHRGLGDVYSAASKDYYENVTPYYAHPTLAKFMSGEITNPRNVSNNFRNPDEAMEKVVNESGIKDMILHSELGKSIYKEPSKLASVLDKLEDKGLSSYVGDDLKQQLSQLGRSIKYKRYGTLGVGGLAATAMVPHWLKKLLGGL